MALRHHIADSRRPRSLLSRPNPTFCFLRTESQPFLESAKSDAPLHQDGAIPAGVTCSLPFCFGCRMESRQFVCHCIRRTILWSKCRHCSFISPVGVIEGEEDEADDDETIEICRRRRLRARGFSTAKRTNDALPSQLQIFLQPKATDSGTSPTLVEFAHGQRMEYPATGCIFRVDAIREKRPSPPVSVSSTSEGIERFAGLSAKKRSYIPIPVPARVVARSSPARPVSGFPGSVQ